MSSYKDLISYVYALFELGQEEKILKELQQELTSIKFVFDDQSDLVTYLSDYNISFKEKETLIKEIIKNKFLKNWFLLIIENKKAKWLSYAINRFLKIANKELGIKNGVIWVADSISDSDVLKIKKVLEKRLNSKVSLDVKINKELVGGIKINVGDEVWDNTIKQKIKTLTKELLEREHK